MNRGAFLVLFIIVTAAALWFDIATKGQCGGC